MNFIFPMGGLSSRFTNAGYTVPKFQLEVQGATVFEHAVVGFHQFFNDHNFVFAFRGGAEIASFINEKCRSMGIPASNIKLVALDKITSGQAETVRIAIEKSEIPLNDPIVIFNIDTFQSNYTLPKVFDLNKVDGYLEVFVAQGTHWSFVDPGADFSVRKVTEKIRISDYCSSGLYHFRRAIDFCKAYDRTRDLPVENLQGGERYVAPLYNDLIKAGADIRYDLVDIDQLAFCGIPEEYDAVRNRTDLPTSALLDKIRRG